MADIARLKRRKLEREMVEKLFSYLNKLIAEQHPPEYIKSEIQTIWGQYETLLNRTIPDLMINDTFLGQTFIMRREKFFDEVDNV